MTQNFRAVAAGSLVACAALMTVVAVLYARPAAGAQPPPAADPAVIRAWDAIAVSTIAGPAPNGAGKANVEAFLWFPFVQAAVYNAVNGITGEYELYKWNVKAPKGASPQAAAAAAAHGVLMEYFGTGDYANSEAIAANLNAQLATSLGQIPDGLPKEQGIRYGERAVERLVELRQNDGRSASSHVRRAGGGGRLASDATRIRPVLRPVVGSGRAVRDGFSQPVPTGSAARDLV